MDPNGPPLLLSRVCRRWRRVAYSTSLLWTSLHISLPDQPQESGGALEHEQEEVTNAAMLPYTRKAASHQMALKAWLSRTGTFPLSISLHCPMFPLPADGASTCYQPYLSLLLPHLKHLHALEVTLRTFEISSFFAKVTAEEVPMLEAVRISFEDIQFPRHIHPQAWHGSGILQGRNLRSVHLTQFPFTISPFISQWPHLTSLEILSSRPYAHPGGVTIIAAYELLSQCSHLMHCSFEILDMSFFATPFRSIVLPSLQSLSILDRAPNLYVLWDALSAPALTDIRYHTEINFSHRNRPPLLQHISCSRSQLRRLAVDLTTLNLDFVKECFRMTPDLTHFVLESYPTPWTSPLNIVKQILPPPNYLKTIFELLVPNDIDGNCFWRNLSNIRISYTADLTERDLLRFIEGRLRRSALTDDMAILKNIQIDLPYVLSGDIQAKLLCYRDSEKVDGLNLVLNCPQAPNYAGHFERCPP
ncbi:hypothetical protein CVT26_000396 [Gymnopilus dilepis]|uniref:F-box domain-containing protein n=1 Tax=Gymnopilus dilepis TaxID=231916 RepID=A0A409VHU6_9AGAR|nr:hypothetical protein CVT26_000396 [Gymnopilus dilepis]